MIVEFKCLKKNPVQIWFARIVYAQNEKHKLKNEKTKKRKTKNEKWVGNAFSSFASY